MGLRYEGNDAFLSRLSRFSISWEAFEAIRIIGSRRFKNLVERGNLYTEIWDQWVYWINSAPKSIQDYIQKSVHNIELMIDDDFSVEDYFAEDEKNRLKFDIVVREMTLDEIIDLISKEPKWLDGAPKTVKGIVKKILLHYHLKPYAPDEIKKILDDFLKEAVEFAGYAGMFDD